MTNLIVLLAVLLAFLFVMHKFFKMPHSNILYRLLELFSVFIFVIILNNFAGWLLLMILLTIMLMLSFGIHNYFFCKLSAEVWIINLVLWLLYYFKVFDAFKFIQKLL